MPTRCIALAISLAALAACGAPRVIAEPHALAGESWTVGFAEAEEIARVVADDAEARRLLPPGATLRVGTLIVRATHDDMNTGLVLDALARRLQDRLQVRITDQAAHALSGTVQGVDAPPPGPFQRRLDLRFQFVLEGPDGQTLLRPVDMHREREQPRTRI